MRAAVAVTGIAGLLLALPAQACGYCLEDQIAATYDHAVVTRALAQQHHVVFFHIDGALIPGEVTRHALEKVAQSPVGVDIGSVRVALDAATLSLAFDPKRTSLAELHQTLARKLMTRRLSLQVLRVMERPAELKAIGKMT